MIDKTMNSNIKNIVHLLLWVACLGVFFTPAWAEEKTVIVPVLKKIFAQSGDRDITVHWKIDHADKLQLIRLYRKDYSLPMPVLKAQKGKQGRVDKGELIAELKAGETQFVDENVAAGYYYAYRMQMQYEHQTDEKISPPAIAALKDKEPPRPPVLQSLKALDEKQIEIRWQASPSKDVVAYRIYRTTERGRPQIIRRINIRQVNKKILSDVFQHRGNGEFEYHYALAAVDGAGNVSQKTTYKKLRMPDRIAPRPPSMLQAKQKQGQVVLHWRPNRENDIAGYRVYRRDADNGSSFKAVHKGLLDRSTFTDKNIKSLHGYVYRVSAVDRFANESRETRGILIRTVNFEASPKAPAALILHTNKQGFPHLRWRKADNSAYSGFIVQRSDGREFKTISGLLKDSFFIDETIRPNHAYRYRVQTMGVNGHYSPASSVVIWTGGHHD